jgi:hypothetical protein
MNWSMARCVICERGERRIGVRRVGMASRSPAVYATGAARGADGFNSQAKARQSSHNEAPGGDFVFQQRIVSLAVSAHDDFAGGINLGAQTFGPVGAGAGLGQQFPATQLTLRPPGSSIVTW